MDTHVATRAATPAQLAWLTTQLAEWQSAGVLDESQATAIRDRYHPTPDTARRFSVARLLLSLGAVFVGVGLIWLVAANLDQLPPLLRFLAVAAIWLGVLVTGEVLHTRPARIPSPVVGTVRLLAALAFGAVIFQAAQSLQVPAYEPGLVGLWAAGALVHAYTVRGTGPLLVGVATLLTWFVWQVMYDAASPLAVILTLGTGAVIGIAVAALHEERLTRFAPPWREVGAFLALTTLFGAALPFVTTEDFAWSRWLVVGLVLAGLAGAAAALLSDGRTRLEPLAALGVLAVSVTLVLWDSGADTESLTVGDWAHAGVSVAVYVVVAVGTAVLGILRDSWRLTALSAAGLVVFTTFQSFAVFAQIIQGAWLFVALGLVFLGTGYGFDRARRELAATLEGEDR
ncbi:MAG: DUF2157 domain-containing protein [Nocardioides sp.]